MMKCVSRLLHDKGAAAAAEMVLITPMLLTLMLGSAELGNYMLTQHAVTKQVRDGARYGSRLTFASSGFSCPGTVFDDGNAETNIINVTKTGSVDGTATGRFASSFWVACPGSAQPVTVSYRCVSKADYGGIYTSLDGDIPVVTVSADVKYPSLFASLGFDTSALCLHAKSESAAYGL
jgi:hypothetical protein